MKRTVAAVTADAITLGVAVACVLSLLDWLVGATLENITVHAFVRAQLLGLLIRAFYYAGKEWTLPLETAATILAVLWLWRGTRPFAARCTSAVFAAGGAWGAALTCAMTYGFTPAAGLVLPAVAVLPAVWLAHRSVSITAVLVFTTGLGIGVFCAQIAWLGWFIVYSPLYGFLPAALLAFVSAWIVAGVQRRNSTRAAPPIPRMWGACTLCLCIVYLVGLASYALRARAPELPAVRVIDEWSYDLYVRGEPPALLWTNRERVQVLDNAYEDTHARRRLDETASMVERIWRSANGDFYLQSNGRIGWWSPVPESQPIPPQPTAWLPQEDWLQDPRVRSLSTFAEDPVTRRFVIFSEWLSHYAVVDRDTRTKLAGGILSNAVWAWWYVTTDAARRVGFISSAFDDGGLYELNFDSLQITRSAPHFYLYETVLDPAAELLWGARPLAGELLAVDVSSLSTKHRIAVDAALRDVQLDPETGDVFTCSFLTGNIYRVERKSLTPAKIGWCGRLCRNLYLDTRHHALWVATADGVCRVPTTPAPR